MRLNLYTVVLAYTMNTDYISYYFSPLVSWWYLIIYFTMLAGAKFNDRTIFVVIKILLSMAVITTFMATDWLLPTIFSFLERICGIHWSAREWAFRVNLDIWIAYLGMLAAVAFSKMQEYKVSEYFRWLLIVHSTVILSSLVFIQYFIFKLNQQSKFTYTFLLSPSWTAFATLGGTLASLDKNRFEMAFKSWRMKPNVEVE